MAYDNDSLRFTGTSGATTAITTATTGTHLGVGQFVGAERLFMARLYVPTPWSGLTSQTTAGLAVKFQDSTTLAGTYTDMGAAFTQYTQTTNMQLRIDTTGTVLDDGQPLFCAVRTRKDKPFVRIFVSAVGTTVLIDGYYVVGTPIDEPAF